MVVLTPLALNCWDAVVSSVLLHNLEIGPAMQPVFCADVSTCIES